MIAYLDGRVAFIEDDAVVVDVQGVGYRAFVPEPLRLRAVEDDPIRLYTYQHVREDAILLYGFATMEERRLYVKLQSAGGVGPKLALQLLSRMDAAALVAAIRAENWNALTTVPGVGMKTAQRIAVDLRDKLDDLALVLGDQRGGETAARTGRDTRLPVLAPLLGDARDALTSLGYSEREATAVLVELTEEVSGLDLPSIVRRALRQMSR